MTRATAGRGPRRPRADAPGSDRSVLSRRSFLEAVACAGTAAVAQPSIGAQPPVAPADEEASRPGGMRPPSRQAEQGAPPQVGPTQAACGSDYMVDVFRDLGIEYLAAVPGNTFKGLHESVVNYGMRSDPPLELLTCTHEEISVALCHGYAKAAGKPMACVMHSTVGLQHGAMALYNAWADRVPVFALVGAQMDAAGRGSFVDWAHAVFDGPGLVRDFLKWDDTPGSLTHFQESASRALKFSMTPPYGPTLLALDQSLQEDSPSRGSALNRAQRVIASPPAAEAGAVREAARLLLAAESPLIIADRAARTPRGLDLMVTLAETLQAAVVDLGGRMNFPWRHPLNQFRRLSTLLRSADVILALELTDLAGVTDARPAQARRISISASDVYMKSNYQDFDRFTAVDARFPG